MFTLWGRDFHLVDLLPPRHAVTALNKVFTLGAGINEVGFELSALAVLSVVYFGIGVWLFRRMHLR
jgi:ABC-2 type transport system permease protein